MTDILAQIAEYKRADVAGRKAQRPQSEVETAAAAATAPRGFAAALTAAARPGRLALIAAIKKASPSTGLIREDFDPPTLARAYAAGGAACHRDCGRLPRCLGQDTGGQRAVRH